MRVLVALLAATVVSSWLASPAWAHVTVEPGFLSAGETGELSFDVPNELRRPMVALVLEPAEGLELVHAIAPPGWRAAIDGGSARYAGGSLAPRRTAAFRVHAKAGDTPGSISVRAVQRYPGGQQVAWDVALTVVPAADEGREPGQHLGRALVTGIVGLAVVAGSLLLLGRLRRR